MMFNNPRVRAVLGAGTALVVVAGIGIGVATSSSAASARFVTATAATGDVTQTYTATGTITRKNTVEAAFTVDGTVKRVDVAVGDEVTAGDTLATLNKAALQLAVLNAETSVARANASLYAARHPSSTSSGSGSSGGSSGGSGSGSMGVTIDPMVLNEAASRVNLAVLDEADKCTAIFAAILPEAEPTPTASPTATATAEPTDSGSVSSSEETATATPSATATPTAQATTEAGEKDEPTATASASQLASTLDADFTDEQLQACANARAEVFAANTNLQAVVAQLTNPTGGAGGSKASTSKKKSSSSSSSSVSASAVASAKADLLEAEQDLAAAREDLAAATLVAPISGTVGVVGLAKGDSASAGTITIVGSGSAVVTFELPLKTRELVKVGQSVTVTPAGSTKTLTGKITGISSLETSGTSGDTPTYTTTVSVSDADGLLASGAKASVLIPVKSASSVLRVPASAVTPTGSGTATVQVVENTSATTATTTQVETGAVGSGWVQITSGLDAGALVVLADNTAEIPSNTTNRRTTTSSSTRSSASASATAAATAGATASAAPSAQPTSTAGR
jgi:RND family efflux transporter MFP subunit